MGRSKMTVSKSRFEATRNGSLIAFVCVIVFCSGCPNDNEVIPVDDDNTDDDIGDDDTADDDTGDDDATDDDDDVGDDDGDWVAVSAGVNLSCGLHADGSSFCWGNNDWGQESPPQHVQLVRIAAGELHACGLTDSGEVICWGVDDGSVYDHGQVSGAPQGNFVDLTVHSSASCAVRADNTYACWGTLDEAPMSAEFFQELSVGDGHLCGVIPGGAVECRGGNMAGQTNAPDGLYSSVSAGAMHSCAIQQDGETICWGCQGPNHDGGQCDVPTEHVFTQVEAGGDHTCGLTDKNEVICWGAGMFGSTTPPDLLFSELSAFNQGCAITVGGQMVCWGCNPDWDFGHCTPP